MLSYLYYLKKSHQLRYLFLMISVQLMERFCENKLFLIAMIAGSLSQLNIFSNFFNRMKS